MFFLGIMGIDAKVSKAGVLHVPNCPVCGGQAPLHVVRRYQYFHVFFLPLIPFNSHYIATCPGCASVFEITNEVGDSARKNGEAYANPGQFTLLQNNLQRSCPVCGAELDPEDNFCRNCGSSL